MIVDASADSLLFSKLTRLGSWPLIRCAATGCRSRAARLDIRALKAPD
jgi:hypothetical protein